MRAPARYIDQAPCHSLPSDTLRRCKIQIRFIHCLKLCEIRVRAVQAAKFIGLLAHLKNVVPPTRIYCAFALQPTRFKITQATALIPPKSPRQNIHRDRLVKLMHIAVFFRAHAQLFPRHSDQPWSFAL